MAYAIAALGAAASVFAAVAIGRRGGHGSAALPTLASEGTAWSAGITLAFGAAMRAIDQDREQGILALCRSRGASMGAYVRGRVGGLVLVLAAVTGGAALVAGLAATSVGPVQAAARSGVAALAYALAFSATIGPVAMAALSARTRAGGYVTLLAVLVVPELLLPWTSEMLPRGWNELASIPAALEAVRAGAAAPLHAGAQAARALAALAAIVSAALVVVGMRAARLDAEPRR
jgi:hypothetical protein